VSIVTIQTTHSETKRISQQKYLQQFTVKHPTQHTTGHFGNESFEAINCSDTDNQTHSKHHSTKILPPKHTNWHMQRTHSKCKPTLNSKPMVPSSPVHTTCTNVEHDTAQNSSDNLSPYPPYNQHNFDTVWQSVQLRGIQRNEPLVSACRA